MGGAVAAVAVAVDDNDVPFQLSVTGESRVSWSAEARLSDCSKLDAVVCAGRRSNESSGDCVDLIEGSCSSRVISSNMNGSALIGSGRLSCSVGSFADDAWGESKMTQRGVVLVVFASITRIFRL